jgi:CRISPR-associated protein Csd1
MLVQALADYADTYLAEELAQAAFEVKPVRYLMVLNEDGSFVSVIPQLRTETKTFGKKEKTVEMVETLRVPRSPVNRNSGVHPLLGCDALHYVLGPRPDVWTTADNAKEIEKQQGHFEGFQELLRRAGDETGDETLKTCVAFYENAEAVEEAAAKLAEEKPPTGSLACLAVMVGGKPRPIIEKPLIRDYWLAHYNKRFAERHAKGGEGMCLVSGEVGPLAVTHSSDIKGLGKLGGQAKGVALMSFDKDAFKSYGWDKAVNSPVSPERAQAYGFALNDLLKLGNHHQGSPTRTDFGGVAFLYWLRKPGAKSPVKVLLDADPDDVKMLFDSAFTSKQAHALDSDSFHLLAVSGNGGRLVVRDCFAESLETTRNNVREWFQGLAVADVFNKGEIARPPALYWLLQSLCSEGQSPDDKALARIAMALVRRALTGQPLGRSVLAAALNRVRREQGSKRLNPQRMGLIRLCINDIQRTRGGPIMAERLDENEKDAAYLCGRLLAVYEAVQYQAVGDVNVNVGDRYFAIASTRPLLAFMRMKDLSRAHLQRLRKDKGGAYTVLQGRINDYIESIGKSCAGNFPTALSLEEQGRFVIGYHHQKAEDARAIEAAKQAKAEKPDAASMAELSLNSNTESE